MSFIEDRNKLKGGAGLENRSRFKGLGEIKFDEPPAPKAPIKPSLVDQLSGAWHNVSQPVRDLIIQPSADLANKLYGGGQYIEKFGNAIQPDTIVVDGKRQATENKTFNDLTIPELKKEVDAYTTTPDKANGIIYQLRDINTGDIKWGRSKSKDAFGRWGADKNFGEGFEVLKEIPVTDMHYVERLIHGNKDMMKAQTYGWGNQQNSPLTGGGTEIYTNDPLTKASMSKVQQLLNPDQMGLAEQVYEQISTVGRKWGLAGSNIAKTRFESMADQQLGAGIGINKAVGGVAGLLGDSYGKQKAQQRATQISKTMADKDSASATVGEILPELGLPVVGFISKTAPLAKRVIQGAGSGALLTGGYEALKEQSGIKEGLDTNVAMATGIGGVIGGVVGGLTKNPALGKAVGEAFENGDETAREAILQAYPEARGVVDEYFRTNKPIPSKAQPAYRADQVKEKAVTEVDSVKPDRIPLQKKEVVKPTNAENAPIYTKNGVKQTSKDLRESKNILENIELKAVEPKSEVGKELAGQVETQRVDTTFKQRKDPDAVNRQHGKEQIATSGGETDLASFKEVARPEVKSVDEEIARQLKIHDDEVGRLGEELTKKQKLANRLQVEKDQLQRLSKDETLPEEIRKEASEKFEKIKEYNVKDYKASQDQKELAKTKELEQYKIPLSKNTERHDEIRTEYAGYKEAWTNKKTGETYKPEMSKEEADRIVKVVEKNSALAKRDAQQAVKDITDKEAKYGRQFSPEDITKEQRKKYRDDIAKIENYQDAKRDWKELREEKIDIHEFQYRARRRLDEDFKRDKDVEADSIEDAWKKVDEREAKYLELGIKSESSGEIQRPPSGKELTEDQRAYVEEKKKIREAEEISKSEKANKEKLKALEVYKKYKGKVIPRYLDQKRGGQRKLTEQEMQDIDEKILTPKEIADRSNPIGTKAEQRELRKQRSEDANLKVSEVKRKQLGINKEQKQKYITFKETMQDVSNSMGQNMAVMLGSESFAKFVKTAGTKNVKDAMGKLTEIREILGQRIKDALPADFPIIGSKDAVKPTFLTQGYGQAEKGLLDNIVAFSRENSQLRDKVFTRAVTRNEAEQFLAEYTKAFEDLVPELKQFKEVVKDLWLKSGGEIKYELPNGFKVELTAKQSLDGTYTIRDMNGNVKVKTNNVDTYSSSLMPLLMQSIDAFVAHEMGKLGILGKMDAFKTPLGKTDDFVRESYGKIMSGLNESNMLDDIMKQIGYEGKPLKEGTLKSEDIMYSAKNEESITKEEIAGESKLAKPRKRETSTRKTPEQLVKEVMAQNNVYDTPTEQLTKRLVLESNLRDMSRAKEGDDVFERQIALAHQSSIFNEEKSFKAPKGTNKELFDKVQREIFNEARARLEASPTLVGKIAGERKFFTEEGKLIGNKTKTYEEIIREEIVRGNLEIRKLNNEARKAVKQIAPTYDRLQMKVKSWEAGKQLNHAEAMAKELVHNARQLTPVKSTFQRNIDKVKAYFKDQVSNSKTSKDFQKLLSYKVSREGNVAERAESLKKDLDTKFKGHKQEDLNDAILRTDFHAIQELKSADEADALMKEHDNIYQSAKDYIDQSAKAIGEASEQIGFFRNNAKAIADELNLPSGTIPIIDKMISIKAMTPKAWKKIEEIRDTEDFKYVMEIIGSNKKRSAKLFGSNPNQQVKGYVSEVYNSPLKIEGDKVRYDADTTREDGAIPNTLERKKVGRYQEEFPRGDFKTLQEKSKFAQENKLKVTENGNFRKVADAELKDKAGRSKSFSEILTKTTQSIDAKETQQLIAKNIIDEMVKGNEMFSQTPKEGYRLIEDNEVSAMPKVVGDSLAGRYVLEAYDKRLFGRDEIRLYNGTSQVGKIADRLIKNTVMHFKQNNILKNPKSYVNATLVNQLLATSAGVNPVKLLKYQKQAIDEIKITDALKDKIAILKARGQSAETLEKELEKSLLYQMEQAGLAINKLEVAGDDTTLLGQIMSDMSFGKLDRLGNEAYLSQKSIIGKPAFKLFSIIDTQGRYTIAKNAMDNGKTLEEAVQEANGLFSDMGQMAPAFIELMDKYPFIPFMKWASLTIPRLMKLTKENPVKALTLGMIVYGMQIESQKDFSTVNPLEAVVNFGDDAVTLEYLNAVNEDGFGEATKEKIKTFYTPKVYKEIASELERSDEHDWILKDQIKGRHQPITQRITNE